MKKRFWLLCLMTMLIIVPVSSAFADSTASYDSNASVGFYGEYVYPDSGATSENGTTMSTLPQTGDSASSQTTLIGLLFISCSFLFVYKRKQRTI